MQNRTQGEEARRAGGLYADDGGAADGALPVVFLHSLAGSAYQWAAQIDHLRSRRRAAAFEWRGHGRSGAPADGDYSVAAAAVDLSGALNGLGLERFVLVGHSGGALVALQYAAEHPERVAGLLLADPAEDFRQVPAEMVEPFLARIQSHEYAEAIEEYWRTMLPGSEEGARARVLADLKATPKQTVVSFLLGQRSYDPVSALRAYPGPVLSIITSLNDAPFSLHNLHPGLPYARLEGTGHWLQMDKPEEFNRLLEDFVARVEGEEARG